MQMHYKILQQLAIDKLSSKIMILFKDCRPWEGLNPIQLNPILSVPTHCNLVKSTQAHPLNPSLQPG